jgi:quinol monooxygenase YgiN
MYARMTTLQVQPGQLDHVLHALQIQALAAFRAQPGCGDISIYARRPEIEIMFISMWDTREQAEALTTAQDRLSLLERLEPDLASQVEAVIYEVIARA